MDAQRNAWNTYFDDNAPEYLNECFTQNTDFEVDFLVEELNLPSGARILDVGCGVGRHSVPLAQRGYRVTGLDLSAGMLAQARAAAEEAGVEVEWVQADASKFCLEPIFQAALCLCEGSFGLLGAGDDPVEHPLSILRHIAASLVPGAPFVLNALNGMRKIRQATDEEIASGAWDPMLMVERMQVTYESLVGSKSLEIRERTFIPTEVMALCRWAGFDVRNVWGGTAGNWGRRPMDRDEMEMMVVATRRLSA